MKVLTDSMRRSGKLDLKAKTGNLDFLLTMLPSPNATGIIFRQASP